MLRAAVDLVPHDVPLSATYTLLPHLSHRELVYNWPNPFVSSNWGNDDCARLPDPRVIQYIAVDVNQVRPDEQEMFAAMIAPGGPFDVLLDQDGVVVAERVGATPEIAAEPQAASCQEGD